MTEQDTQTQEQTQPPTYWKIRREPERTDFLPAVFRAMGFKVKEADKRKIILGANSNPNIGIYWFDRKSRVNYDLTHEDTLPFSMKLREFFDDNNIAYDENPPRKVVVQTLKSRGEHYKTLADKVDG